MTNANSGSRSLARSLVVNTLLGFVTRFVYVTGWLVLAPVMVARLGAERFGFWAILGVVSGFFMTFDLGLGQALTKFVAEFTASGDHKGRRGVYTAGMLLYCMIGLLWAALLVAFHGLVLDFFHVPDAGRSEMSQALFAAALTALLLCPYTVIGSVLTGLQRLDLWNAIGTGVTLLQLAAVAALLALGHGLVAIAWAQTGSVAVGLAWAWLALRRADSALELDPSAMHPSLWGRLTRYSGALQVINLGVLCQFQLPKVLLGRMDSLTSVAHYELGLRVGFTAWSIALLLAPPLVPALSHLDSIGDRDRLMRLYRRASRYLVGAGMLVGGALVVLAQPLFAVWLGVGQGEAALVCAALGGLMMVNMLTTPGCLVVRGTGNPWMEARYQLVAIALHVVLGPLLIARMQLPGALLAMGISVSVGTLVFLVEFHRAWRVSLRQWLGESALPALTAVLLAGAVAWPIWNWAGGSLDGRASGLRATLAGAAAFAAIALPGLLIGGAFTREELLQMLALVRPGSRRPQ